MKKISLIFAALLSVSLFSGCPSDPENPAQSTPVADEEGSGEESGSDEKTAKYELSLEELGSGYKSTYDAATKTITYENAWAGRGWWLGSFDVSSYEGGIIKFGDGAALKGQVVIEYCDASGTKTNADTVGFEKDAASVEFTFSEANVMQIYIQNEEVGSLTLSEAYLY